MIREKIAKDEYPRIAAMYSSGMSGADIARQYSVTRERIRQILIHNYPDVVKKVADEREAKKASSRLCSCGKSKSPESKSCFTCACNNKRVWTRSLIIKRMMEFRIERGRSPSATDFSPALARQRGLPEIAKYWEDSAKYPATATVVKRFGSWNNAMDAAGLPRNKSGRKPKES